MSFKITKSFLPSLPSFPSLPTTLPTRFLLTVTALELTHAALSRYAHKKPLGFVDVPIEEDGLEGAREREDMALIS